MIYKVSEKEINKIKAAVEYLLPIMVINAHKDTNFDVGDVIIKEKLEKI